MLKITKAEFITSAASKEQFVKTDKPIIAVSGKSNVGKSSFINMLANQKKLAKVSKEPGRTRLVNYFDFGSFILADLPGYGYAAVSKTEQEKWGKTLDAFFAKKEEIAHVFLLGDIRRDPSPDDMQMVTYLNYYILPFTVIATKSDKLSRMKRKERVRAVANAYGLGIDNVISVSGLTGEGKEELLKKINTVIQNA